MLCLTNSKLFEIRSHIQQLYPNEHWLVHNGWPVDSWVKNEQTDFAWFGAYLCMSKHYLFPSFIPLCISAQLKLLVAPHPQWSVFLLSCWIPFPCPVTLKNTYSQRLYSKKAAKDQFGHDVSWTTLDFNKTCVNFQYDTKSLSRERK